MALTDFGETQTLRWLVQQGTGSSGAPTGATAVAPVMPLMVALVTTTGTDATPGTEVTTAGGSGYQRQQLPLDSVDETAQGEVHSNAVIRFDNMPDIPYDESTDTGGVRGFEIWDSAATPQRWWFADVANKRGYAAGDAAEFPIGELILAIQ